MNQFRYILSTLVMLCTVFLAGCSDIGTSSADAVIRIKGRVDNPHSWTEEELASMETVEQEYTDEVDGLKVYTGVPLAVLLKESGVQENVDTLQFVKYDGSSLEIAASELDACETCLVTFEHEGKKPGITILLPDIEEHPKLIGINEIILR